MLMATVAAMVPSLGFVRVARPSVGAAMFTAFPSWRALWGSLALLALTSPARRVAGYAGGARPRGLGARLDPQAGVRPAG